MGGKKILIFLLILAILPSLANAMACSVKASCTAGTETPVLELSDTTNAHAAVPGSGYGQKVCCNQVISATCDGNPNTHTIVKLSANENAHAEDPSLGNYTVPVCIRTTPAIAGANGVYLADSCDGTDACIASISGEAAPYANAHLAQCTGTNSYAKKICVKQAAGATGSDLAIKNITVATPDGKRPMKGQDLVVTVTIGKISATPAGTEKKKTASLQAEDWPEIYFAADGTIEVSFTPIPGVIVPAAQITQIDVGANPDSVVIFSSAQTASLPGGQIYELKIKVTSAATKIVTEKTIKFAMQDSSSTANVPETSLAGALVVALGVCLAIFIFSRRKNQYNQ